MLLQIKYSYRYILLQSRKGGPRKTQYVFKSGSNCVQPYRWSTSHFICDFFPRFEVRFQQRKWWTWTWRELPKYFINHHSSLQKKQSDCGWVAFLDRFGFTIQLSKDLGHHFFIALCFKKQMWAKRGQFLWRLPKKMPMKLGCSTVSKFLRWSALW